MRIEEAAPGDLPTIQTLLLAGLEEEYGAVQDFSQLWQRYVASTPRTIWVARVDQQVVGFVWLVAGEDPIDGCPFDYVFYVTVNRPFRRQGIGRALVSHCQAQGRNLRLLARRDQRAMTLYQRLGFSVRALEWEWQA